MKPILSLSLTASLILTAQSFALLNGSFETGDLTGWTFSEGAFVVSNAPGLGAPEETLPDWGPAEGDYFAYLQARDAGVYTTISQNFTANSGDTLRFDVFFDTGDYFHWDDNGYAVLQTDAGPVVLYSQSVSTVGDYGADGWTEVSYTFDQAGAYTLEFGVANAGDGLLLSVIGIDNVTLIPEPGTLLLLSLGGWVLRRRQ